MDNTATVSINLHEGSIVISGSEDFIEKNMKAAFDFVEKNLSVAPTVINAPAVPAVANPLTSFPIANTAMPEPANVTSASSDDKYIKAGVYHIDADDGTISILKKVPGDNKAEKTKNIALIVLYIRKGKVPGKEIIPICEKHACYDSSNFSAIFKNEKTNIVRKGSGQSWTIELTQPGETAALTLLEEMANDKK